jgi:hypothetical protein
MKKIFLIGAILLATLPASAVVRGHAVVIFGPAYVPFGWYDWYGPYYYGYYGFDPYGPRASATGEVKLDTKIKNAEVFVNGDYAGTVKQLKTMRMRPGNYDFSIRAAGREPFEEKVYVVAGKTLKLHPYLHVQSVPTTP